MGEPRPLSPRSAERGSRSAGPGDGVFKGLCLMRAPPGPSMRGEKLNKLLLSSKIAPPAATVHSSSSSSVFCEECTHASGHLPDRSLESAESH